MSTQKKKALGDNPLDWIQDTTKEKNVVSQTLQKAKQMETGKQGKHSKQGKQSKHSKQGKQGKQSLQGLPIVQRQTYHVEIGLIEKVKQYAYTERLKISQVINQALKEFLQRHSPKD